MADDTGTTTAPSATVTEPPAADATATATGTPVDPKDQNDVPPEVKRALTRANKEAETLRLKLKEYEDRDKTEQQKLEERATAAERAAALAGNDLARMRVALDKGLPSELAARLQGSTVEELNADADKLLELFGSATTATSFDGGARTPAGRPQDMNDLIRRSLPGSR